MRAVAENQQPGHPACLPLALAGSLETLERDRSGVDKPSLGVSGEAVRAGQE